MKNEVPRDVLVSLKAWQTFVEHEAREEKLAQRAKAKESRNKKTDAHFLGRTSYAEVEEKWPDKPKHDRVDLYVGARTNLRTKEVHSGAISDVEEINRIKNSQDQSSNASLDTDALTQHFGKHKRGRTVSITKLNNIEPIRNEIQKVKAQVDSYQDMAGGMMGDMRANINKLLKYAEEGHGLQRPNESRGSHVLSVIGSSSMPDQRSTPDTPHTSVSRGSKYCHLKSLDGRKAIDIVMIEKVSLEQQCMIILYNLTSPKLA